MQASVARWIGVSFVAYLAGIIGAALAIYGLVDIQTLSVNSGLPKVAMATPMLAVVIFWAVANVLKFPIQPMRIFIFGGIAVYSVLYACGRLVGSGAMADGTATIFGAVLLFIGALVATKFVTVRHYE